MEALNLCSPQLRLTDVRRSFSNNSHKRCQTEEQQTPKTATRMSQLRFDVLAVSAGNTKNRTVVPPDDPLVSEMFSPTLVRSASASTAAPAGSPPTARVKTSRAARSTAATLGVTQLQASPLHAGKVLLRNAERFPVLYRVHILRTHATRKKRKAATA